MNRRYLLLSILLTAVAAIFACGDTTTKQQGALVLIITTDLSLSDMNTFRVEVSQENAPGTYGDPLIAKDYAMPAEASLPATMTLTAGSAASQNVLVRVIGRKVDGASNTPVVLREAEVRVPNDRVAAITMILSSACAGQVKTDATGRVVSTCSNPHESCQPTSGACGSSLVDVNTLPNYDPSRDASLPNAALGDAAITSVGPSVKEIQSFVLAGVPGTIAGSDIFVSLPPGTNVKSLAPAMTWAGAKIAPDPSLPQDWTSVVKYVVTARDESELIYSVHVSLAGPGTKQIDSFTVPNGHTTYYDDDTIGLDLPYGTDVTHLVPTIAFTGKSISPKSGEAKDFTNPVDYTVTAYDDSTRVYTVSANVASASDATITSFKINGIEGDISGKDITVDFGETGVDWSALTAIATISGKGINPDPAVARNYSSPVTFTVTSFDGQNTADYKVTVKRANVSNVMFSPLGGSYTHAISVKLSCRSPGAEVYFTNDGTQPTASPPLKYTGPISMPVGTLNKKIIARCFSSKFNPAQQSQFAMYGVQQPGPIDIQDELVFPPKNCGEQPGPMSFSVSNNTGTAQNYTVVGGSPPGFTMATTGSVVAGNATILVTPEAIPATVSSLDDITAAVSLTFGGTPSTSGGSITLRQPIGTCPP